MLNWEFRKWKKNLSLQIARRFLFFLILQLDKLVGVSSLLKATNVLFAVLRDYNWHHCFIFFLLLIIEENGGWLSVCYLGFWRCSFFKWVARNPLNLMNKIYGGRGEGSRAKFVTTSKRARVGGAERIVTHQIRIVQIIKGSTGSLNWSYTRDLGREQWFFFEIGMRRTW